MRLLRPTNSFLAGCLLLAATSASARNIDLSTLPARDTVQLTIYNAEDLTLVRETRTITFKEGMNPLQFSWANTLIDPTSVELKFLSHADSLDVLDTTFPHDKPQMLYWNVRSEHSGEARVEISYFTSGITWSADYVGIADPDETRLSFEGFVTVTNNSGEDYEDAQVRLVVGTINLVETIAELARRGLMQPAVTGARVEELRLKRRALKLRVMEAEGGFAPSLEDTAAVPMEKQVIKEGLSEYFIFTVEGRETVPSGWSKRMRSLEAGEVPIRVEYRYRPREYGDRLVRMFLATNDSESGLGDSPLPDGIVRLFRKSNSDGLSYLVQQPIKYVPIGDKIELNLGVDPRVVFELTQLRTFRDNIWGSWQPRLRVRFDEQGARIDNRGRVTGWDEHRVYAQRIRNYTETPIAVEIRRVFGGDATFRSRLNPELHDFQTVEVKTGVGAGGEADLRFEVVTRQGDSAKQNRVVLEAGAPAKVPWL